LIQGDAGDVREDSLSATVVFFVFAETFFALLVALTGAVTTSTMLRVCLRVDAGISTRGLVSGALANSLLTGFAACAGHPATAAVLVVTLGVRAACGACVETFLANASAFLAAFIVRTGDPTVPAMRTIGFEILQRDAGSVALLGVGPALAHTIRAGLPTAGALHALNTFGAWSSAVSAVLCG
jgi:hypothetical protein